MNKYKVLNTEYRYHGYIGVRITDGPLAFIDDPFVLEFSDGSRDAFHPEDLEEVALNTRLTSPTVVRRYTTSDCKICKKKFTASIKNKQTLCKECMQPTLF